jgi:hypothetical protein
MKAARTKAAKLRAKRGRPKKDGLREPNGRLSRSGVEHGSEHIEPVEARARRLGIPAEKAMDQKAGSFIGYLNLIGPRDGLSDAQYEGAQQYLQLRQRVSRALQSAAAVYDPEAPMGDGTDPEAYEQWCKDVLAEDKAVRDQIQAAQNYSRDNLWAALQYVVIDGMAMHHMIGATRVLCNVFARHFKTMRENRNAA